jgi:hypothetical protein
MASKIPIKFIIELDAEHIKLADPVMDLVNVMTNQLGLNGIHFDLFTILIELYNYALLHGVLELDSGTGFKHKHILNLENVEKIYGRGISLVKELSEPVGYGNNGITVDVVFKI